MRLADLAILILAGLLALFTLPHALWNDWQEYAVACASAGGMSWLASRPKRYRPSSEKPWRLISR